jgi:N utilization substance protein A
MKIKYDLDLMRFISMFESLTRTKLKDCFIDDNELLTFVVEPGEIGRAVGKKAGNVKKIEAALKRKIKVVEYNPDVLRFVQNMILPLRVSDIKEEDGVITLTGPDSQTKGLLIGRSAANLRLLEKNVKRYFDIKEIKVV